MARQSFAFPVPPPATNAPSREGRVLEIRQLRIAAQFDSQNFTYRTGPYSYERDPYAEFLVPPAESLTAAVRGYLQESGLFSDVITRETELLKPDMMAEIYVTDLYGDFRNKNAPAAVLRLSFVFLGAVQGSPKETVREYEQRVSFHPPTASGLMAGWNTALKQLMASVDTDLKTIMGNSQGPISRAGKTNRSRAGELSRGNR